MCASTALLGHTCVPTHCPARTHMCASTLPPHRVRCVHQHAPARTHTCASTGHSRMHTHPHAPCGKARVPSWVRLRWPRLIRAVLPQTVGVPPQEGPCPLNHLQQGTWPWPGAQEPIRQLPAGPCPPPSTVPVPFQPAEALLPSLGSGQPQGPLSPPRPRLQSKACQRRCV